MAGENSGHVAYGISVAIASFTGAVLGLAACGFGAALLLAGLEPTVLCLGAGAVIGSRHLAERRPSALP
jgi:hypothetical protein